MFQHILVPCDFSAASDLAFEHAVELARFAGARLTLCHILSESALHKAYDLVKSTALRELEAQLEVRASHMLERHGQCLAQAEVAYDLMLRNGHVGEEILAAAETRSCDLIVIGSRGQHGVSSLLLGSTSRYVLQHAPCPVLVVPSPAPSPTVLF